MSVSTKTNRRNFLQVAGSGAAALAASGLGLIQPAFSQAPAGASAAAPMGPVRQIKAGTLNVGYVEAGPANGPVVILLHGWPYDIHSFAEVAPLLAAQGYRVIVPHLRGYGTTTFLSADTPRNGQQAVLAVDIINLMDALKKSLDTVSSGKKKAAKATAARPAAAKRKRA